MDDGFLSPSPGCARAVREAVTALEKAGHECVPFQPVDVTRAICVFYGLMTADGLETIKSVLEGEQMEGYVRQSILTFGIPMVIKRLLGWVYARQGDTTTGLVNLHTDIIKWRQSEQ